jgi:hypothetical protein
MFAAFEAACCAAKGVPLRDPRNPSEPELFQLSVLPTGIGDRDNRVVERGLNVRNAEWDILALALLELFCFALLAGLGLLLWFRH